MDALGETAWTLSGSAKLPVCLHGPRIDEVLANGKKWTHGHAFILPEDEDGDSFIDHVTVSAAIGLDPKSVRLLAATDRLNLSSGTRVDLMPERMARLEQLPQGLAGPARTWISSTAYLPPNERHHFDKRDAAKQLKSEINSRIREGTLTVPLVQPPEWRETVSRGGVPLAPDDFHISKDNGGRPPDGSAPCFFRLTFTEPVSGPLAFGWACHNGLGIFMPDEA
ncbi:MAG: hypothetical protein ABL901_15935 [Hyphomicrobiaceae bacterium]